MTKADERRRRGTGPATRRVGDVRLPEEVYTRLVSLSVRVDKPLVALVRRAVMEALPGWEDAVAKDRMALL